MQVEQNSSSRKKKKNITLEKNELNQPSVEQPVKKRGRKPKGGKILETDNKNNVENLILPNVIIHLKCSLKDLEEKPNTIQSYNNNDFGFEKIELAYQQSVNTTEINNNNNIIYNEDIIKKDINRKIKELEVRLHLNDVNTNNSSACFWCTYNFDNLPFYIPKHFIRDEYEVYGCFCSPECSVAFLMNEHIDFATKFERYHLLNNIYGKINNYESAIKPAPNPFYTLDKFNGTLSIGEYRSLFKFDKSFLIVDKPLTKILPELHEDNDDFLLNNKSIPSNTYSIKKNNLKKQNKTDIINNKFGLN